MLVIRPGWKSELESFSVQFSLSQITYFDFLKMYFNGEKILCWLGTIFV